MNSEAATTTTSVESPQQRNQNQARGEVPCTLRPTRQDPLPPVTDRLTGPHLSRCPACIHHTHQSQKHICSVSIECIRCTSAGSPLPPLSVPSPTYLQCVHRVHPLPLCGDGGPHAELGEQQLVSEGVKMAVDQHKHCTWTHARYHECRRMQMTSRTKHVKAHTHSVGGWPVSPGAGHEDLWQTPSDDDRRAGMPHGGLSRGDSPTACTGEPRLRIRRRCRTPWRQQCSRCLPVQR